MWADAAMLKDKVFKACDGRVVVKPQEEKKEKRPPIPQGPTLMPLETVYDIIPK